MSFSRWLNSLFAMASFTSKKSRKSLARSPLARWKRCAMRLEELEPRLAPATWTPLTNLAPNGGAGTMLLLTDGTVIAQGPGVSKDFSQLTPDSSGSYINGTWSALAPMGLERLYYGSKI